MSNVVNQLLETANPYTSVAKDAARLAGKWEKSGLLEGIGPEADKSNMAILLENQAKQLVVEASSTGTGGTFTAGTGEQYAAVALPLVRKVFGQIAAKEFVSVQPMSLPAGLVFYLDFQYGTTKKPFVAGESMYGKESGNFGNEASGGLYGAGRFGYSINEFSSSVDSVTVYSSSWSEVNFDSDLSASVARNEIKHIRIPTASISSNMDLDAIRAFVVSSGSILESRQLPAFTFQPHDQFATAVRFYFTGSAAEIKDGDTSSSMEQLKNHS